MLPRTKVQFALIAAVTIAGAWLYHARDFEPLLAFITSSLAYAASLKERGGRIGTVVEANLAKNGYGPHPDGLLKLASIIDRPKIIQNNHQNFPPLTGTEILRVLETLSIIDRPNALPLLLTRLRSTPSNAETEAILYTLSIIDREAGARHLSHARPCAQEGGDG
jgi:hypothetical protein